MDIKRSKSSADKEINNILFVFAMEAEAEPLRTRLDLKEIENSLLNSPCKLYSGTYNGATITIAMNGKCPTFGVDNVGTTPAALTTFLAINQIHPDIVINAGTAGGFKRKTAAIGDCFLSTHVKYHDRRIPIPGFTEYGIGSYTSVACPNMVQSLNLKTGVVSTSNSLDHCDADDKLLLENGM